MPKRYIWLEEYRGCGCVAEAERKKDLPGYCATHGTDRKVGYKFERDKWNKANADNDEKPVRNLLTDAQKKCIL